MTDKTPLVFQIESVCAEDGKALIERSHVQSMPVEDRPSP